MKKTALITGASSGIGLELAKIHAQKGGNLVLVARNKEKLKQLKAEWEEKYSIEVHVLKKDLSEANAAQRVYDFTQKEKLKIDYLINNAGFGNYGLFQETQWQKEEKMIQLNITALTQLCKLYLKDMVKVKSGKIMNIASTAAFQPGPMMAVYFATKSYVLHFSEAIGAELKSSGVSVTALCPGPTASGFQSTAAMEESGAVKGKQLPTAKEVAEYGYQAMLKGAPVAIHKLSNRALVQLTRFFPRKWVTAITQKVMKKAH